nr:YidC/Oxa1 family membrane protein insertase [uncultured Eisenbergiella sp.]
MPGIILTKSATPVIGWVATLLGYIMEGIFYLLNLIGLPYIALAIIVFTIVIYMLMLPLTIKQQKFSKLSNKMNPELQAIQKKYNGKKDNDSMMAMQNETQAVYAKYGVSPMGSCVQMLIQLPIIYALYKVIYAIPAYIGQVKDVFSPMVDNLIAQPGSAEFIQGFKNAAMYMKQFSNELFLAGDPSYVKNTFIDVLNKASTPEWNSLADKFPNLAHDIMETSEKLASYNNLFGMNIGDSPSYYLSGAMEAKNVLLIIAALAIPVLAAVTQWLNVKLMPQPESNGEQNSMMSSMKMMNNIMPIMSAVFCFSLPAGVGLYWVASAVVRSIQQVLVNKHIDKTDFDQLIEKNKDKAKKKTDKRIKRMEKAGIDPKTINQYASMNTRNVQSTTPKSSGISAKASSAKPSMSQEEKDQAVKQATEMYNKKAPKPGSIAAKANMVKIYNENNNKTEKGSSDKK